MTSSVAPQCTSRALAARAIPAGPLPSYACNPTPGAGASRTLPLAPDTAGGASPRTMSADEAYQHALQLLHPRALRAGPQLRGLQPGEHLSGCRSRPASH